MKIATHESSNLEEDDRGSSALKSFLRSKERKVKKDRGPTPEVEPNPFPKSNLPQKDILKVLLENAPLEEWQADIVGILREEAYYFLPQRLTKIMNEGWASYWHSRIMTEKALRSSEVVDFADHHAGVMAMSAKQINPYKIGIELFRDIEYRWDKGKFGKEYIECESMVEKDRWNMDVGLGRKKIFDVRRTHNDLTFIDEFLTPEFCERAKLFTTKFNPRSGRMEIDTKDFEAIKSKLLTQLTNFSQPVIEVNDLNFANRAEMLLVHQHHGVDLDMGHAQDTMQNIYALWKRPINLLTSFEDKEVTFCYDGKTLKPLT